MRVLVVNPPFTEGYCVARWESVSISGSHWYPIFLSSLVGLLNKCDHPSRIVDAQAEGLSNNDVLNIAVEMEADMVVMKPTTTAEKYNMELAKSLKELGCKIVLVGSWCSMGNWARHEYIDHVVRGEFEYTVLDIANGMAVDRETTEVRLTYEQIEGLPWVTKTYAEFLDMRDYRISSLFFPFYDLFCDRRKCYHAEVTGGCTFCLYPYTIMKGDSKAQRKLEDVLDEIEWISRMTEAKDIFFQDGCVSAKRLEEISEGIIERGLKLRWSTYARGDGLLTPAILKKMKQSGCHLLHVGCETFNDEILKNVNKGITCETLEKSIKDMDKAGIRVHGDFIIGLPGETRENIKATVEWAKSMPIILYQFSVPKSYEKTPFYDWLKENNYLKNGRPNYPNLSFEEMEKLAKWAMRKCYFNSYYLYKAMKSPWYAWGLFKIGFKALPWLLWKRWENQ